MLLSDGSFPGLIQGLQNLALDVRSKKLPYK
jgi:hypothetical protein